jgi:hypothetical protein
MSAGVYNITIEKGTTFNKLITVKDGNGVVVDLTGATARSKFRERPRDNNSYSFTVEITDAANGVVSWIMGADVTATLPSNKGYYDLEIVYGDSTVQRILTGSVEVTEFINRIDV